MLFRTLRLTGVAIVAAAIVVPAVSHAQHRAPAPYADHGRGGYPPDPSGNARDRTGNVYGRTDDDQARRQANRDRRDYRRCNDGSGGTILGAIAGGLLGNAAVGHRGNNTAGILAGAGVGALAGNAIDRDC